MKRRQNLYPPSPTVDLYRIGHTLQRTTTLLYVAESQTAAHSAQQYTKRKCSLSHALANNVKAAFSVAYQGGLFGNQILSRDCSGADTDVGMGWSGQLAFLVAGRSQEFMGALKEKPDGSGSHLEM